MVARKRAAGPTSLVVQNSGHERSIIEHEYSIKVCGRLSEEDGWQTLMAIFSLILTNGMSCADAPGAGDPSKSLHHAIGCPANGGFCDLGVWAAPDAGIDDATTPEQRCQFG